MRRPVLVGRSFGCGRGRAGRVVPVCWAFAGLLLGSLTACKQSQAPVADMVVVHDLVETQAELIANGDKDVQTRGCPMCHQSPNAADGILSGSTTPVPGTNFDAPNLTPDPTTGIGTWTDAQIIRAMTQGIDNMGMPLCWIMPKWPIGAREGAEIVAYLRSLKPVMRVIPSDGICPGQNPLGDLSTPADLAMKKDAGGTDGSAAVDAGADGGADGAGRDGGVDADVDGGADGP